MLGGQLPEGLIHLGIDVRLGLDEVGVAGGDAGLDAIVDGRVEMRHLAVARQVVDERHEVGPLQTVFVKIA